MRSKRILLILGIFFLFGGISQAQMAKANRLYRKMAFYKAAGLYEKVLTKKENKLAATNLADCYWQLGEMENARVSYEKLVDEPEAGVEILYRYAQSLKSTGNYEQARAWFRRYAEKAGTPEEGERLANACKKAGEIRADSARFIIKSLPFNSPYSDICPVVYKNGIVFTSNRPHSNFLKATSSLNNAPFYDVFFVKQLPKGGYDEPGFLPGKLNSRYHDGPVAFSEAQHFVYINRSNIAKGRVRRDISRINHMNIYRSKMIHNRWVTVDDLPFNSDEYSNAHPSLDQDEVTLYFSSDMPGGMGGKDLYVTTLSDSGWSPPQNLGSEINTEGNEVFPFIHTDGTLFFASNGHAGLGGLDLFSARKASGQWSKIRNLGYPVNTSSDDFGISWKANNTGGFFSSNRPGGKGQDDIYALERKAYLFGKVVNDENEQPVSGIRIEIYGSWGDTSVYYSNPIGEFNYPIRHGDQYRLKISKDGFKAVSYDISTRAIPVSDDIRAEFRLSSSASFSLLVQVLDGVTGQGIEGANLNLQGDRARLLVTDTQGQWEGELPLGYDYSGLISAEGYDGEAVKFSTRGIQGTVEYVVEQSLKPQIVQNKAVVNSSSTISGPLLVETAAPTLSFSGPQIVVTGSVVDQNGKAVAGADVLGTEWWGLAVTGRAKTDANGKYSLVLPVKKAHAVSVQARGYKGEARKKAAGVPWGEADNLSMSFAMKNINAGEVLKRISFVFGHTNLNLFIQKDLDEVVQWMKENPGWKLEIVGQKSGLFAQRAKAIKNYLEQKGVSPASIQNPSFSQTLGGSQVEIRIGTKKTG